MRVEINGIGLLTKFYILLNGNIDISTKDNLTEITHRDDSTTDHKHGLLILSQYILSDISIISMIENWARLEGWLIGQNDWGKEDPMKYSKPCDCGKIHQVVFSNSPRNHKWFEPIRVMIDIYLT